jgi:hypothetical protein
LCENRSPKFYFVYLLSKIKTIIAMKKVFALGMLYVFVLQSCKKSSTEDVVPSTFQWPAGTGEYAPYTNGSTFTFESSTGVPATIDSFTYTVIKDTNIAGANYKKLVSNNPAAGPTYFANYNNGVLTEVIYNFSFQGFTLPELKQTILKDNVAVNATWNETLNIPVNGITIPITLNYTLQQKDFTKTILGKNYTNCIAVKQVITLPALVATTLGVPADTQIDNTYAKGVGRVDRAVPSANTTVKIKRYNVVK